MTDKTKRDLAQVFAIGTGSITGAGTAESGEELLTKKKDFDRIRLLNRKQAAEYLGLAENTLAVWKSTTRRYDLPVVMVGRLPRYRQSDLDSWLASRTVGVAA